MKKTTMALSGVALTAATAVGAYGVALANDADHGGPDRAERRAEMMERMFVRMDVNEDGAIDADEIDAARGARFSAIDTDGDGVISSDEMKAHAMERAAKRADARFAKLDANDDGGVDPAEMTATHDGRHKGMFERMDADGDGRVTREEAAAAKHSRHHGKSDAD